MHRKHPNSLHTTQDVEDDTEENHEMLVSDDADDDHMSQYNHYDQCHSNALFSLALEAKHKVSKCAIDSILDSTATLLDQHLNCFKQQLKQEFGARGLDAGIIDSISVETFLEKFSTDSKRQQYYKKNMTTFVEPEEVILGKKFNTKNGVISEVLRRGYIIPFEKNLRNLLSMPEVWHCVQNPHFSSDEFMYDICDGDYVQHHELFTRNNQALQIILNFDDLEIVNPLGSHVKKHKVSMFYFTIANVKPQFRSRLNAIQLLAVARTVDARRDGAINILLQDFIRTLNRLSNGGIPMMLHGSEEVIEGALVIIPADTLAANWLGGFKEGVSFALKNCRHCEVESSKINQVFVASQIPARTDESHKERCTHLSNVSAASRMYWSKLWGINGTSILLQADSFSFVDGLVQDPMHVLLEGTFPHELSQSLYIFIYVKKFFTLKWLNTTLSGFKYSYLHTKSRPEPIEKHHIDGNSHVKQTASAMLTLAHVIPIMLSPKVPEGDANWLNLLRLLQIIILCTSPYCSRDTSCLLEILIAQYLHEFKILYPRSSFIPKMHFMVHLPRQMLKYGPTRHHWCMRFEGKNSFFAQKKYKNFKNLPLTLAQRHQVYMCYVQSGSDQGRSMNYLYEGDIIKDGNNIEILEKYPTLAPRSDDLGISQDVFSTTSAVIHGLHYQIGCAVVIGYEDNEPVFAVVLSIIVSNHEKYLIVERMSSVFENHILSYIITSTGQIDMLHQTKLKYKWPMSVYMFMGKRSVMNVYSHTGHLF
jgi:hypothetical protein